jgi:guanine deaminase
MNQATMHETYMQAAFVEAFNGVESNHGGPFGAVIVLNGEVVGKGHNRVAWVRIN